MYERQYPVGFNSFVIDRNLAIGEQLDISTGPGNGNAVPAGQTISCDTWLQSFTLVGNFTNDGGRRLEGKGTVWGHSCVETTKEAFCVDLVVTRSPG